MKLVSNHISPNLNSTDSLLGLRNLFNSNEHNIDFSSSLGTSNYILTNAARTALSKIIDVIKPPKDKKIGIPAFICAVVVTPFLTKGYEICWIDTDKYGVISLEDLESKISELSMIVVPHIFGQKAPIKEVYEITRENNIFMVEDGAHYFNTSTEYCDAKILSFGREKVFSCVSGGVLLWKDDSTWTEDFKKIELPSAPFFWTFQHLLQPLILSMSLPIWNTCKMGKAITALARKVNLLPFAVTQKEKQGIEDFPQTSLPYSLQVILQRQFKNAEHTLSHNKNIALKWKEVLQKLFPKDEVIVPDNYFRVILKTDKQQEILQSADEIGFNLREWDGVPISPSGVDSMKFEYEADMCPNAETFAQNYVTFPTNVRVNADDVARFSKEIKN